MKLSQLAMVASASLLLFSCVSSKKFKSAKADYEKLEAKYTLAESDLAECSKEKATLARQKETLERELALMNTRVGDLNSQVDFLKANSNQALKQLESLSCDLQSAGGKH